MSFKACFTDLLISSVDSKCCPFTTKFIFKIKRSCKVQNQVNKEAAASPQCIWMSKTALNHSSCCCFVRFLGTILAQIFFIHKSSVSIKRRVFLFMFTSSAIILTVNLWSDRTSSLTHAVSSPVHFADGCLLQYSSSTWFLPWAATDKDKADLYADYLEDVFTPHD